MSRRTERLGEEFREEIARMIGSQLKDPRIGFVTVTRVEVGTDLRNARIFVGILGGAADREKTLAGLRQAAGFMRRSLGQKLRLRHTPELTFTYDEGLEAHDRIARLLAEVQTADAGAAAPPPPPPPPPPRPHPKTTRNNPLAPAAVVHGVMVVDKPAGPTSHDVVDRVRRALGVRKAGHTGTLDPFATGVLPVCIGKATRLARFLTGTDKTYRATVRLGFATTTDDLTGDPLGPSRGGGVSADALASACRGLTGPAMQTAPAFSAKWVKGRRAYDLAREGVEAPRPVSSITVHAIEVLGHEKDMIEIEVRCSAGTYIRALARDLGEALGTGAHLVALRRTVSGPFTMTEAVAWDEIGPEARITPLSHLLGDLPAVTATAAGVEGLRHGRALVRERVAVGFPDAPPPDRMRVLDEAGELVALAVPRGFDTPGPGLTLEPVLHPDIVLVG